MSLINDNDIVTFRKYVKMSFIANAVKSLPDFDEAERKFLIPVLTQTVYNQLQNQVTSNVIVWGTLLNICRAVVAPLAVWLDLPFRQATLSDKGLQSDTNAAHQWEYNKIEQALINKGMAALEDLIEHLIVNASTYSWSNPDTTESFFRTGKDISPKYVNLYLPNVTFQALRPLISEVEDHFIKAAIGEETFIELRDKANPVKEEKEAIQLIKKSIAQYMVVRAVERMPVKITPYGLMSTLESGDGQTMQVNKPADNSALLRLMECAQREGDAYHIQLKQHLNKYASSMLFAQYKISEHYKAPVIILTLDINDFMTGICAL